MNLKKKYIAGIAAASIFFTMPQTYAAEDDVVIFGGEFGDNNSTSNAVGSDNNTQPETIVNSPDESRTNSNDVNENSSENINENEKINVNESSDSVPEENSNSEIFHVSVEELNNQVNDNDINDDSSNSNSNESSSVNEEPKSDNNLNIIPLASA